MTVGELIAALEGVSPSRPVEITLSYRTGESTPLHDLGTEGHEVILFPETCLDGDCP